MESEIRANKAGKCLLTCDLEKELKCFGFFFPSNEGWRCVANVLLGVNGYFKL